MSKTKKDIKKQIEEDKKEWGKWCDEARSQGKKPLIINTENGSRFFTMAAAGEEEEMKKSVLDIEKLCEAARGL